MHRRLVTRGRRTPGTRGFAGPISTRGRGLPVLLHGHVSPGRKRPWKAPAAHRDEGHGRAGINEARDNVDTRRPSDPYGDLRLPFLIRSGKARQRVDFPLDIWKPHGGGSLSLLVDCPTLGDPRDGYYRITYLRRLTLYRQAYAFPQ